MNMATYKDIREKLKDQIVYLENKSESAVVKLLPGKNAKTFIKFKGEDEYEIDSNAVIIYETCLEAEEITEDQYNKY